LLKASQASEGKEVAEPPPPSPTKRDELQRIPAKVPSVQKSTDEKQVFRKTFACVGILVLFVSIGFSFGARMAIQHWAENPGGGGWIDFSGMIEVMILWGLQMLASVLCFYGGFSVASSLSMTAGVKMRYGLPYGAVLGLIAVGANFFVDAITVMGLMITHGLP
jgi:dienelactone hydrolase